MHIICLLRSSENTLITAKFMHSLFPRHRGLQQEAVFTGCAVLDISMPI